MGSEGRPRRIVFMALYLLFAVAAFEAFSRLALRLVLDRYTNTGNASVQWRQRWIEVNRSRLAGPYRFARGFDRHDPRRGWALQADLRNLEVFAGKRLNSNSRGLRGVREYRIARMPGVGRILCLGDSYTFGEDVSDGETYPSYLRELLPEWEILNFGVHGYGHDQMLIYLCDEGVQYRPDLIVLGFYFGDLDRNMCWFRDYAKPRFAIRNGRLRLRGVPVPAPDAVLAAAPYRLRSLDVLSFIRDGWFWKYYTDEYDARKIVLGKMLITAMRDEAHGIGAEFVFMDVCSPFRLPIDIYMAEENRSFSEFCRIEGIPYLTMASVFEPHLDRLEALALQGHWSPEANRLIAAELHAFLVNRGLVNR
ncbi:SGNH/GDSL hydrolase family protein [bacterium]|nr:SGNH/GDSL hydrolase family protein [candidate division CSSED10-310 bacterium]